jgi:hypothetical protein
MMCNRGDLKKRFIKDFAGHQARSTANPIFSLKLAKTNSELDPALNANHASNCIKKRQATKEDASVAARKWRIIDERLHEDRFT